MFAGYIPPQLPTADDEAETSAPRQQPIASDALTRDNMASIGSGEAADVQTPLPSQHPGLDREHAGGASGSFSSLSVERSLDRHRDSSGSGGLMGSRHQHHLQVSLVCCVVFLFQHWTGTGSRLWQWESCGQPMSTTLAFCVVLCSFFSVGQGVDSGSGSLVGSHCQRPLQFSFKVTCIVLCGCCR